MMDPALIQHIEKDMAINLPVCQTSENLEAALAEVINDMIQTDFDRLVMLLYRIDIDERQLTQELNQPATMDTGLLLAKMVIARQLKKIATRQQYTPPNPPNDENERW